MNSDAEKPRARKYFGQHFLHDQNVIGKILVAIDPQPGDHIVEIGPGHGALTRPLLDKVARLSAIEIDRDLAARLRAEIDDPKFRLIECDALKFDFGSLDGAPLRLVGNLPYNISTPLLFHVLKVAERFKDLTVMLQKEVVQRICAAPGNRTYGRLSVAIGARCRVEPLFDIRPGSFTPPPQVMSAMLRLIPAPSIRGTINDEQRFNRVVTQAFSMRRKRLSNALKGLMTPTDLETCGVDPGLRAEDVEIEGYIRLANCESAAWPG